MQWRTDRVWLRRCGLLLAIVGGCGFAVVVPAQADEPVKGGMPTPAKAEAPASPSSAAPSMAHPAWEKTRRHGLAAPKARTPGAIRFADYNIENLFDDKDDPKLTGKADDASMTKPEEDRRNAAMAIHMIDADVLCLEEVESLEAVKWFRDQFLKDMGYTHIESIDAGDGRGIEQAVLSRFPLSDAKVWPSQKLEGTHPRRRNAEAGAEPGTPIMLHRSPMLVTVTVPAGSVKDAAGAGKANAKDYKLRVMVLHHKSGKPNGYWRDAEAKQFVKWAGELQSADPNANIIICGDFNARAGDKSVQTYFDAGFVDSFVAAGVKKARETGRVEKGKEPEDKDSKKGKGARGGEDGEEGGGDGGADMDAANITHASERAIDFILMNPNAAKELVPMSAFVLGTGARERGVDFRNTPSPAGWASDHYPLVVDLVPVDK